MVHNVSALGAVRGWLPQILPLALYFKNKLFCRFFFLKSFKPLLPPNACYALPLCSVVSICLSLFVFPQAFLLLWPLFLFCPYTVTSVCNRNGQTAQKPFLFISLLVLSTYTFTFKTYCKKVFPLCRHFYSLILICHYGAITAKNLLEHRRREVIYCRLRLGVGHNVLQIGDGRAFQHKS
jgi:hypothetical protein